MSVSRRRFLSAAAVSAAGAALPGWARGQTLDGRLGRRIPQPRAPAATEARDEELWGEVQRAYDIDRSLVNLDNGGVNPSPRLVMDALHDHWRYGNEAPVYTMNRVLWPQAEGVRRQLARALGADPEEVAIVRNTTEAMHNVLLGLPLQPGDEVVTTTQDYWRFINALKQREVRDGIVLKQIPIPVPARDPAEVVARFEAAVTPRTRVLLLCHIINLTGQILPVRDVAAMGRRHGLTVLVDGAHSFAHWPFDVQDLGADAYGTSLHKWLGAPHGTGMLWVRRERIPDFWPLFPAPAELAGDIRKFESLGTRPAAPVLAIAEALTFWHSIGAERKEARLRYLRDRWAEPLASDERFRFLTAFDPAFSCALATVDVEGMEPVDVQTRLWERDRILVRAIRHPEFQGVRVTPNVYTTLDELDRFVEAMRRIANAA